MNRLARIARVQKRGKRIDSGREMASYWRSKTPDERIQAAEELRREAYRLVNGRELPRMTRAARVIRRTRP